jgi:hypothetical protein
VTQLTSTGTMTGGLRIPGAVGPLHVTADLRAGKIVCYVDVEAPRAGKPTTRVNWLVRQLRDAPDTLSIEAFAMHARGPGKADLLRTVRSEPATVIGDPTKELRSFRVDFYEQVIQNLKPWMPAPPRLRSPDEPQPVEPVAVGLPSSAISSQDGPDLKTSNYAETSADHPGESANKRTDAAAPDENRDDSSSSAL